MKINFNRIESNNTIHKDGRYFAVKFVPFFHQLNLFISFYKLKLMKKTQ